MNTPSQYSYSLLLLIKKIKGDRLAIRRLIQLWLLQPHSTLYHSDFLRPPYVIDFLFRLE